jgi:ribA/ribD-fused uncharacterized protein
MERQYKVRTTDTHVYFLTGPFSQWHPSEFMAALTPGGREMRFSHAEQYMMAGKAMLFEDHEILAKIMDAGHPRDQKELGRMVRGFDPVIWDQNAREIVYRGNMAKFSQDDEIRDYLLATGDRHLVEGAWYDPVWGVALAWDDDRILDQTNWKGTNWLGETLMQVREALTRGS